MAKKARPYDWEDDAHKCYALAIQMIGQQLHATRTVIVRLIAARAAQ